MTFSIFKDFSFLYTIISKQGLFAMTKDIRSAIFEYD